MNRQIAGWIIMSVCILWGILRATDLVDPNFVLNFFAILLPFIGPKFSKN